MEIIGSIFLFLTVIAMFVDQLPRKSDYSDERGSTPPPTGSYTFGSIPHLTTTGMFMSKADKVLYLQSQYWHTLKAERLVIAGHVCEHCRCTANLQLHHTHYANLGFDTVDDVAILCGSCHSKLHKLSGQYGRRYLYPLSILKESPCNLKNVLPNY